MRPTSTRSATSGRPQDLRRRRSLALMCLVLLLGAALRFYDLGAESYWRDEIMTLRVSAEGARAILADFLRSGRPPLHYLTISLWTSVCGTTEFATRSLSAFAGVASIAIIYATGRSLFSRRVAVVSSTLLALSEFQVLYAQEARYYALFLALALVSFYLYVRTLQLLSLIHI